MTRHALDLPVDSKVYGDPVSYRIKDVAERSGFSATTLRYYEEIGVLPAAGRTEAGYRVYDDRSLDRLAFIARAKQLGCRLEEITELVAVYDGGECGPVQDRLRALATARLDDTRTRVAELVAFAGQLQASLATLSSHRPDGPCDDLCGCVTELSGGDAGAGAGAGAQPVALAAERAGARPAVDEPVACTLTPSAVPGRMAEWHAVLANATERERLDDGVRVRFAAGTPVGALAELAAAEQACCRFFSFALTVDGRGVALEVRGPDDARPVIDAVFGDAPTEEIAP